MLKNFIAFFAFIVIATGVSAADINLQAKTEPLPAKQPTTVNTEYKTVSPLDLVAHPSKYLNKQVSMKAKFDKFSAIGLDYPPVKKDAKTYISFLIKRENVTAYNIPLSELKLIVNRDYAEKNLVNIEQGDEIEIYGKVFSAALGDPWVEVDKVKILSQKEKKDNEVKSEK